MWHRVVGEHREPVHILKAPQREMHVRRQYLRPLEKGNFPALVAMHIAETVPRRHNLRQFCCGIAGLFQQMDDLALIARENFLTRGSQMPCEQRRKAVQRH